MKQTVVEECIAEAEVLILLAEAYRSHPFDERDHHLLSAGIAAGVAAAGEVLMRLGMVRDA